MGVEEDTEHPLLQHVPAPWAARYRRIAELARQLGRMPRRSDVSVEPADISWVADQKRADQKRAEGLSPEQEELLGQLPGWEMSTRDGAWEQRADDLRRFIAEHGREPRRRAAEAPERSLANWVARQRAALDRGRLRPWQVLAFQYALRRLS